MTSEQSEVPTTENYDELGDKSGLDMDGWKLAGLTGLFVILSVAVLIGITVGLL